MRLLAVTVGLAFIYPSNSMFAEVTENGNLGFQPRVLARRLYSGCEHMTYTPNAGNFHPDNETNLRLMRKDLEMHNSDTWLRCGFWRREWTPAQITKIFKYLSEYYLLNSIP
jgi:hypothetical protein